MLQLLQITAFEEKPGGCKSLLCQAYKEALLLWNPTDAKYICQKYEMYLYKLQSVFA